MQGQKRGRKSCGSGPFRVKCGLVDVAALLKLNEGKTLEFKRDLSSPDRVLKCLVAFANTAGGTLLIGVEDGTRHVRGVQDSLAVEGKLANLIADSILPRLLPEIEIIPWRKVNVIAVQVFPSNTRPHFIQRLGPMEGVFIRVGSTNRKADAVQIRELKSFLRPGSFDEEAIPDLKSEVIDFRAASEFLAPFRRVEQQTWINLKVTAQHQRKTVPTIGGLLLFGRDRFSRFPDSWIQAGRFAGTNRSRLTDSVDIRAYLPAAAEEAVAFTRKHLTLETVIQGMRREERWSVPLVAIREAVVNAIVHADYAQLGSPIRLAIFDDRIEIENPGLLPFGLTIEDILHGVSKLRNRVIGRVFRELRLVEQWGSGIQRMTTACEQAGLQAPKFQEIGTHFRVTIPTMKVRSPHKDEKDRKILDLLADGRPRPTSAIARHVGLSERATLTRLKTLTSRGLIVEIGMGPHDPKRQYGLA